ncbi:MADS-box protein AGL42 [Glycine max]|nr:MADS-box protein AGL42 [Glycine max]
MTKILERYREYTKDVPGSKFGDDYMQQLKLDSVSMTKKIELLEHSKRKLLGQSVSSCSFDELKGIEEQLRTSLQRVRQRKYQRAERSSRQQWPRHTQAEAEPHCSSSQSLDVDTELFIGLPKQQC